ncbi:methyltransferase [Pantoea phage Phynn]|nr:methyltransferase [Pantoea phage Phynn]
MAKLTKLETKKHNQIQDLVNSDKPLTYEEKIFILENFHEGAYTNNSELGAFFTPMGLARDFSVDAQCSGSVVDLCAGIGMLSFVQLHHHYYAKPSQIVCVELNRSYYELGRRILPEATWIHGDALSIDFDQRFDMAISNPPFGKIKTSDWKGRYSGSEFEFKVIERASQIADTGFFIIPQMSSGFKYSANRFFEWNKTAKVDKFEKDTGIKMEPGCGVDTGIYKDQWNGVSPICEIVCCEFQQEEPEPVKTQENFTFRIE